MRYRRAAVNGGTYFFTVNLADRHCTWLIDRIDALRTVVCRVKDKHPFRIDAMVILPDHLHAVWTLPAGDRDYAKRWMLIKAGFSRQIGNGEPRGRSRVSKGERGIWQRRYWEHLIRDERDYGHHVEYIHYNPVKHGYVPQPADWPYSSIHRYIAAGIVPAGWGATWMDMEGSFGER